MKPNLVYNFFFWRPCPYFIVRGSNEAKAACLYSNGCTCQAVNLGHTVRGPHWTLTGPLLLNLFTEVSTVLQLHNYTRRPFLLGPSRRISIPISECMLESSQLLLLEDTKDEKFVQDQKSRIDVSCSAKNVEEESRY